MRNGVLVVRLAEAIAGFLCVGMLFPASALALDPCERVFCAGHGTCVVVQQSPVCSCFPGFLPDRSGLNCVPEGRSRPRSAKSRTEKEPAPEELLPTEDPVPVEKDFDWIRWSLLVSAGGMVGTGLSFFGFEREYVFVNLIEGGFLWGRTWVPRSTHSDGGYFAFAGTSVGWLHWWRSHFLSVGLRLGFGWILATQHLDASGVHEESLVVQGMNLSPILRYRHYWNRFGLEVSLEMPLVFGAHFATPMPVLGLSVGM